MGFCGCPPFPAKIPEMDRRKIYFRIMRADTMAVKLW